MLWSKRVSTLILVSLLLASSPTAAANGLRNAEVGLTYQSLDGNRYLAGRGALPGARVIDVALERPIEWIVGVPVGNDSLWVAVLNDGSVRALSIQTGSARSIPNFEPLRLDGPPVLIRQGRQVAVPAPAEEGSPLSHAVPLARQERLAFVSRRGHLGLATPSGGQRSELALRALPDARLLADETGRVLLLSDPTERYSHGALGDGTEAASMTLIDAGGRPRVIRRIEFPQPAVFEGLAPIWSDWNRDGKREIVATLSSDRDGARLVLYDESGDTLAESPAIGTGQRWRHAIAVAPFGPDGEMELAEVLTPHLGGVVQFLKWDRKRLQRVARISGFTSHVYGSRNLDLAAAGDFDADGHVELLLPTQDRARLSAIRRTPKGAERAWEVKLPAQLSSNLGGVTLAGGRMIVAVGLSDGTLRFYHPR
jgi:hypothetical protein